jgi:hypothetical protein
MLSAKYPNGIEVAWEEKINGDVALHMLFPGKTAGPFLKSLSTVEWEILSTEFVKAIRTGARAIRTHRDPPTDPRKIIFGDQSPLGRG